MKFQLEAFRQLNAPQKAIYTVCFDNYTVQIAPQA